MRRPDRANASSDDSDKPDIGILLHEYPQLYEYLTESKWDDGKPRERATLLVIAEGCRFKLWLNDKALGRSCWVSGATLEDALLSLDTGLAGDSLEWRRASQGHWKGKGKSS